MKTGWLTDPRYLEHQTGRAHPERPERLQAICKAVREAGLLDRLVALKARPAAMEDVPVAASWFALCTARAICGRASLQATFEHCFRPDLKAKLPLSKWFASAHTSLIAKPTLW